MFGRRLRFSTWIKNGRGRREVLKAKAILAPSVAWPCALSRFASSLRMGMAWKLSSTTSAALVMWQPWYIFSYVFTKADMSNGNFCRFCKEHDVYIEAWFTRTVACWMALWML